MGWSEGKGLGVKEDGPTEHVRVAYKCDSAGLGFQGNPDTVEPLSQEYERVLARLNEKHGTNNETKKEIKVRHRYGKVLAAKTVSNYSVADLAAIFGTTATTNLKTTESVAIQQQREGERKNFRELKPPIGDHGDCVEQSADSDSNITAKSKADDSSLRKTNKQKRKLSGPDCEPCEPVSADESVSVRKAKKGPKACNSDDDSQVLVGTEEQTTVDKPSEEDRLLKKKKKRKKRSKHNVDL